MKPVSSEKKTDDEDSIRGAHVRVGRPESTRTLVALDVRDLHPFIRPVKVKSQGSLGQAKEDLPKLHSHMSGELCSPSNPASRARRNRAAPVCVCVCVCVLLKILQV